MPTLPTILELASVLEIPVQRLFGLNNSVSYRLLGNDLLSRWNQEQDELQDYLKTRAVAYDWSMDAVSILDNSFHFLVSATVRPDEIDRIFSRTSVCNCDCSSFCDAPLWEKLRSEERDRLRPVLENLMNDEQKESSELELVPVQTPKQILKLKFVEFSEEEKKYVLVEFDLD